MNNSKSNFTCALSYSLLTIKISVHLVFSERFRSEKPLQADPSAKETSFPIWILSQKAHRPYQCRKRFFTLFCIDIAGVQPCTHYTLRVQIIGSDQPAQTITIYIKTFFFRVKISLHSVFIRSEKPLQAGPSENKHLLPDFTPKWIQAISMHEMFIYTFLHW